VPVAYFFLGLPYLPYFSRTCAHSDGYHLTRCVFCEHFHSHNSRLIGNLSGEQSKGDRCSQLQRSSREDFDGLAWPHGEQMPSKPVEWLASADEVASGVQPVDSSASGFDQRPNIMDGSARIV